MLHNQSSHTIAQTYAQAEMSQLSVFSKFFSLNANDASALEGAALTRKRADALYWSKMDGSPHTVFTKAECFHAFQQAWPAPPCLGVVIKPGGGVQLQFVFWILMSVERILTLIMTIKTETEKPALTYSKTRGLVELVTGTD